MPRELHQYVKQICGQQKLRELQIWETARGWSRGPFASFQMSLEGGKMEYLPVQRHHALDSFTEDTSKNVDQDV